MELIDIDDLPQTDQMVSCECGVKMPILPPDRTWRAVKCLCGTIWWVKPSGRRFEKHKEHKDFEY